MSSRRPAIRRPGRLTWGKSFRRSSTRHIFEFLMEISFDDGHQLVRRFHLRGTRVLARVKHREAQVAFDQLRHESVEGAATRSDPLQNPLAIAIALKGTFHRFVDTGPPPGRVPHVRNFQTSAIYRTC